MYYKNGFKIYSIMEVPIKIYGLAVTDAEKGHFYRLPHYMLERMPQYDSLGRRSMGGRVRFTTNSKSFYVRMTLASSVAERAVPLSCAAGADIYLGTGKTSTYLGYVSSVVHTDEKITVEATLQKKEEMEIVTINLPRINLLQGMEIGIEENAILEEAPEYRTKAPIVFYGSSITEGGCANRVGNSYTSIVSRWLDADFYNYGFSGSAKGEMEFAEYIASLPDISVFVYDYDHNAPDVAHLQNTHEKFFQIIRAAKPQLPIVILSRPNTDMNPVDAAARREVICQTWQNAKNLGDQNVWFMDGGEFFGTEGRMECTVDGIHPNALGFMRMAEKIYPLLNQILYGNI